MEMSEERKQQCREAEIKAKQILKQGDRIRITKCPGTKRTIIFSHWDGCWIVSKSGINDYHPVNIDKVNGKEISFK